MNVDTGHLIVVDDVEMMKRLKAEGYEAVPAEYEDAAKLELAGRKSCHVGANASGSMSTYMREKRARKASRRALRRVAGCKA